MKENYLFQISFLKSLKLCHSLAKILTLTITFPLSLFILIKEGFVLDRFLDLLLFNLLPLGLSFILSLFLFIMGFIYPVTLNPNEICATDYFGFKKAYTWEELSNLELKLVSGIQYLVFETNNSNKLWVPTILGNDKEFNRLFLEFTKSKNPKIYNLFSMSLNEQ
ncbi:MAG: hypothetical protein RLN90_09150 [Balneolaceae bacterium]